VPYSDGQEKRRRARANLLQDDTLFAELQARLDEQFKESSRLQEAIRQNMEHLKHGL